MKKFFMFVAPVVLLMAFAGLNAFAQMTTSAISGKVYEGSQPVAGAAVVATHTPSGTVYYSITNNEGLYTIQGARSGGPYTVEFSCLGYDNITYTDVTLKLAQTYSLDAEMRVSKELLAESVVIAAPTSKFASTKQTGAVTNISNEQMEIVPTIDRSLTDIAKLSPYGGNGMSFSGMDGRSSNVTVDGANFNNNFGLSSSLPGGGNPISIDAIEEIQVVVSPFDVRQSNFIGGGINAITKSGTNQFKGTAYIYHQNENMRGNTVAGEEVSGARDKERTTTYGGTFGGPIIKNKLFFFVNAEYSYSPTQIINWRAKGVMDADSYSSLPTDEDMQTVSNYLKNTYGYSTGSWTSFPAEETNTKILAKLDWNITKDHHLSLRYNYTLNRGWNATNGSSGDTALRQSNSRFSQYSMAYANSLYSTDNKVTTYALDLNSRLGDNLSNQFLATYSQIEDVRGSDSAKFPFIDILNGDLSSSTKKYSYISAGYELFSWNNGVHNDILTIKDDLTWYKGKHKLTFGASYEYQMADNAYMRNGTGYYRYNSLEEFLADAVPESICITYGYDGEENPAARVRFNQAGIYAQDEWTVNDKFVLTYGARLDAMIYSEQDIMTNNAILALDFEGKHVDTGEWPGTKIQFSPRIGFTWDVLGDKSLTVRGGTGLFAGRLPLVFFTNMPTNSGMIQNLVSVTDSETLNAFYNLAVAQTGHGLVTDTETMVSILNQIDATKYPTTITPEDGVVPSYFAAVDPDFKMPQMWKSTIAVDYVFPTSFPLSVTGEFIFNKVVNAATITDYNIASEDSSWERYSGADSRYYDVSDHTIYSDLTGAYVLTNTHKGYGYTANFTVNAEPVKNLRLTASYIHTENKELTGLPGSSASSLVQYTPTVNGYNSLKLQNSQYRIPDRVSISLSYRDKCSNSYSLFYEGYRGGYNYSYMTVNDVNGDGVNYDLIYIPKESEAGYYDSTSGSYVGNGDFRFASQDDYDRFFAYANNNHYLKHHKGQYAEGYSVYSPWVSKVDFQYTHDFKFRIGQTMSNFQLSFTIKNLLNLFSSKWGTAKYMNSDLNSGRILNYEYTDSEGYAVYSTASAYDGDVKTWTRYVNVGQCWSANIGIKYIFN